MSPGSFLAAWAVSLAIAVAAPAATADTLDQQRASFRRVLHAEAVGNQAQARALSSGLETYPLYPYIRYEELRTRLAQRPQDEVEQFLSAYAGSFLAEQLRTAWLRELARTMQWPLFLKYWQGQTDVALTCQHFTARLRDGADAALVADITAVWLAPVPRPAACDEPFEYLYANAATSDALIWQRVRALMNAGDLARARATAAHLKAPDYKATFTTWSSATTAPAAVLAGAGTSVSAPMRDVLVYALGRLARVDLDGARVRAADLANRVPLGAGEQAAVAHALAVAAADSGHAARIALLDAVPPAAVDADIERYRLREGIAAQAWTELARWTAGAPAIADEALRWRYWRGQALARLGQTAEATALLQALAAERDYYGFLAADKLQQDYRLNFVPLTISAEERAAFSTRPGIVRAQELDRVAMNAQARQEWSFELKHLERRQLEVAAVVAASLGWPDRAISALADGVSYDDLSLRFPLLFTDSAISEARHHGLDPARVLAIMRIESAFRSDARSPAGALGLMQLMPQTARETARAAGRAFNGPAELVDAAANIALGTHYLHAMLERFHGNFALAAAAYNAGPHRVWQWQTAECVAAERWIEMIPFSETRGYVRRAIFTAAIYQWRLQRPIMKLDAVMTPIPPRDATDSHACAR